MRRMVSSLGGQGINYDVPPIYLPGNVWTGGRNIRFSAGTAELMEGVDPLGLTATGVRWVDFMHGIPLRFYLYSDLAKVYSYDGTTSHDITRTSGGDYSSTEDSLFDLENFNGVGILNNGIDVPQQWDPSAGSNDLVALSNWTSNHRAKTIVGFKSALVALNVTKDTTAYPHMIKWSNFAEPGAVPTSWDHTDPTKPTGEVSLSDTQYGEIVNGKLLGDYLYIYKEGSIWALAYVGGIKIFEPNAIVRGAGLKVRKSLAVLPNAAGRPAAHFFADESHFYIMDGAQATPIFEEVFRKEIYRLIDPTYQTRSFSVVNNRHAELWYCIPELGSEFCTLAFVWNYKNNTYSIRELSQTLAIASGLGFDVDAEQGEVDLPFEDLTIFNEGVGFYDTAISPTRWSLVEASAEHDDLFMLDSTQMLYDGTTFQEGYLERILLGNVGKDFQGAEEINYRLRKVITSVMPKGTVGPIYVQVGVSETDTPDLISWSDPIEFNAETYRCDLPTPLSGRFISIRFSSVPGSLFRTSGFDYEIDILGEF